MKRQESQESFLSTIVSIAAPLIQIVAVTSLSLSDQLKLSNFFAKSEFLPLVNFLVIFTILSIIGHLITKQNNSFLLNMTKKGENQQNSNQANTETQNNDTPTNAAFNPANFKDERLEQIRHLWIWVYCIQIPSFFIFLITILFKFSGFFDFFKPLAQYISYIAFLISSGVISFIWLQDYQRIKHLPREQDFVPNLLESLRIRGLLKEKGVEVTRKRTLQDNITNVLRIKIGTEEFIVTTNYSGDIIYSIWRDAKTPAYIKDFIDFTNTTTSAPTS